MKRKSLSQRLKLKLKPMLPKRLKPMTRFWPHMAINFYCTVVSLLGLFCYKNIFIFNEFFLLHSGCFLCWVPFEGC